MHLSRELLNHALSLRSNASWQAITQAMQLDRAERMKALVYGSKLTEHERGSLVGRIQAADDLLELASVTPERVEQFRAE